MLACEQCHATSWPWPYSVRIQIRHEGVGARQVLREAVLCSVGCVTSWAKSRAGETIAGLELTPHDERRPELDTNEVYADEEASGLIEPKTGGTHAR